MFPPSDERGPAASGTIVPPRGIAVVVGDLGEETMSSAEDVESAVTGGQHDERLTRAFDRAARLGIDIDHGGGLSERESAAVRAFTALHLDADPAPGADPAPDAGNDAGSVADGEHPPADDRPLRPDAVLRNRPLTGDGLTVRTPHRIEQVEPSRPAGPEPSATAVSSPAADIDPPSRTIDHYLLDLFALAVATGAFVSPWAWLFVVAVGACAGAVIRSLADQGVHPGPLLSRGARRVLSWLRPRSAIWFPLMAARTVLLAVFVPAVACSVWWVADQGISGALAAGRAGAWAHGFRTGAAAVCFMLVAGVGEAHRRRAAQVRRASARFGPTAVATAAAGAVAIAALVATLGPRADAGRLAGADGLGWVPPRLRDNVDRLRDEVVAAELHAAAGCLSDRQGMTWHVSYTAGNPLDDADVAHLSAQGAVPAADDLTTAAAAVHNQLAPWVERIELRSADATRVTVDRTALPSGRPLVDPIALAAAAGAGGALLADGVDGFDPDVALACASAPVP